jgi:hypothetical protein
MGEIAVRRLNEDTWAKQTGMSDVLSSVEKQELEMQAKQMQEQAANMPPEELEKLQQDPKVQEMMKKLGQPTWGEVLKELSDNIETGYAVDVETNSTLDADATEDKKDIADLVQAMAQIFQSLGPAIQAGALPMSGAKAILLAAVQRYRFSDEVVDMIKAMPEQPQAPPGGEEKKDDGGAEKAQAEVQLLQAKLEYEKQSGQNKLELEKAELAFKKMELQFKQIEAQAKHEMTMQKMQDQKAEREAQAAMKAAQQQAQAAAGMMPVNPQGPGPMAGQVPMGAM